MNGSLKKAALFVGLTFLASWLLAGVSFACGIRWNSSASLVMAILYMFVPMAAAIVVQRFICREPLRKPLGISFALNRWFLVAWLLPPAVALASLAVSLLLPGVEYAPAMDGLLARLEPVLPPDQLQQAREQMADAPLHPMLLALLSGLVAGLTVNAVAGFGEELGWRGLLQRELSRFGFWKSSLVIGLIWGIWHAPIILQGHNYPDHPGLGVLMMIAFTMLLAPLFSYVRIRADSVIAAAIMHGSLNATAGLSLMMVKGGNDLLIGAMGLSGFIVLACANLAILVHDRYVAREPIDPLCRRQLSQ